MTSDQDHPDSGDAVGDNRQQADMQKAFYAHLLDEGRQPEADDVNTADKAEIREGEHIDLGVLERLPSRMTFARAMVRHGVVDPLQVEMVAKDALLIPGQPLRVLRLVVQIEEYEDSKESRRQ